MSIRLPLYKKLTVLFRIEPGCLGPQGKDYVEEFCVFARTELKSFESGILRWVIKPRYDKSLPEIEYALSNETVDRQKADAFFSDFDKSIANFESTLDDKLADLVEQFFER
ncbi:hypothetical protein [Aestuariibacter salexigens]|uniref:hypothetical protein n=1 Tax=Aestuariibacter salexigens TaxID=226010 RepID=UPI0004196C51|nr:hypothetical protein [Aestuariibacter salexigens]